MWNLLFGIIFFLSYDVKAQASNHRNLGLLDHLSCGVFSDEKMRSDNKTGVFEYPWMALIQYQFGNNSLEFHCGGTIINKRYILTAARCVTALPNNSTVFKVRVGDHDISKPEDCDLPDDEKQRDCTKGFQEFIIESIHSHPEFSLTTLQNDIALIRVPMNINFQPENVRPICLPIGSAARFYGDKAVLTGWETREFGRPRSPELLQIKMLIVSNEECAKIYNKTSRFIGDKQICAGAESREDSCIGDIGGPLQNPGNYDNKSKYVQYGIVSYLSKCGFQSFPAVYTSVSHYVDWILDTIME